MTYKPGQIAKATVRGVPDVTVTRTCSSWTTATAVGPTGGFYSHSGRHVTDIRPLVVLDLHAANDSIPASEVAETAINTLRNSPYISDAGLASQIEAQTRPTIEEPKGLGAVVEDDKGVRWVRTDGEDWPWDSPWKAAVWGEITPVRVLSEGVPS
jgi:hypothetical protein